MTYFELRPHSRNSFQTSKEWRASEAAAWRCPGCGQPKPSYIGPIDVAVTNGSRSMMVDFVYGFAGFCVANVKLIDRIGLELCKTHFDLGTVSAKNGSVADHLKTLRSKAPRVLVRGGNRSTTRKCEFCGQRLYLAVDDKYLCGIETSSPLLQAEFGDLLVRSDIFKKKLADFPMRAVRTNELRILNDPLDGMPLSLD